MLFSRSGQCYCRPYIALRDIIQQHDTCLWYPKRTQLLLQHFCQLCYEVQTLHSCACHLQVPASNGGIAAVITEDSDLVSYGCPYVIFKADRSGFGQQLALADLFGAPPAAGQNVVEGPGSGPSSGGAASGGRSSGPGKPASFRRFTLEMLQTVCVLAGCDFLPSIKGVHGRNACGNASAAAQDVDSACKPLDSHMLVDADAQSLWTAAG